MGGGVLGGGSPRSDPLRPAGIEGKGVSVDWKCDDA